MRNVLVTGGSRGLGLGIARMLASVGYRVIAVARRPSEGLQRAIDEAAQAGGAIVFRSQDLAEIAGLAALVHDLRQSFGPIYGLVNNAGIGYAGMLATISDHAIEQLVRMNVLMPITLSKYAVRSMLAAGSGRVVNISSIVAATGYSGLSAYSATKAALDGFTRSLAREVGPAGITVNSVAPGFVATDMTRDLDAAARERIERRSALRRLPDVEDIAEMVCYLLSEKARNITGTVLTVDAGNTA